MTFAQLVDRLRVLFIEHRRRKQAGYNGGKTLEEYLPKIAQVCIDCGATPDRFISGLYWKFCIEGGGTRDKFYPAALSGQAARTAYMAYDREFVPLSLDSLWQSQWSSLKSAIDRTPRTVEDALLDKALPLEPWFRIVCTKAPIEEVLQRFLAEAKAAMNPQLKEFLSKVAPEGLKRII